MEETVNTTTEKVDPAVKCKELLSKVFTPEQAATLVDFFAKRGLFLAPASTMYHGNWQGGLWEHSLAVAESLVELTENNHLTWQNQRSPILVGLFHDACKCRLYKKTDFSGRYVTVRDEFAKGHGSYSVTIIKDALALIGETMTEEEEMCVRFHMGAYTDLSSKEITQKEWAELGKAIEKYPNVLYTHTADMIASKIKGI